ncbi:MAG: enoyl-CoA hydratase/isomerase family protein [Devosia sp.]
MTDELEITIDGALGCIALNRPQAINALSLDMISGILEALLRWQLDPAIGAVVFTGNGPKGFCSGGDVRAARALVLAGAPDQADAYFATEYRMNALIAGYPKPMVTLGHGITMGGGIGIAGHCAFRITQPGARFAMPESAIGLFADVGVNAIVAKAPLNRALLFLLSGVSVGPADALALGLADAMVASERTTSLRADFVAAAGSSDPGAALGRLLEAESIEPGEANFCALADLLPDTSPETPAEFVDRVAEVPALAELAALLRARSPSALTATFYAQLEARRLMDVGRTLAMDLRLASLMSRRADFAEGVRAVLVDKDQKPKWSPGSFDVLDPAPILKAVKGL